jgi:hypothetical protein
MQKTSLRAERDSPLDYLSSVLSVEQLKRPLLTNFNHWNTAQGALADIALAMHNTGSTVTIAFWADRTPMLDVAWESSRKIGSLFFSPTREQQLERALKEMGLKSLNFPKPLLKHWTPEEPIDLPELCNRTNIRSMKYRGTELGRAILQVNPDQNTPMTDKHLWPRKWVEAAAHSFAFVYDQVLALIQERNITCVFVYNGRFLHDWAVAAAAKSLGIPVLNYDLGGHHTDYDLTIDDTHDWEALQRRMLNLYDTWDPHERDSLGSSWFLERTAHQDPLNSKFVEAQSIGTAVQVPEGKKTVVFFSSSGDEISELDLNWDDYFESQENALHVVSRICKEDPNVFFVVRSHPHKRHKPDLDVSEWLASVENAAPDLHLNPHSEVDSYTLMRQADLVITYGSTTGIEAAFAGKPVIVMGPSAYNSLGAAVQVFDENDLRMAIREPRVGSHASAISFGLLMKRRGFNFHQIKATSDTNFEIGSRSVTQTSPLVAKCSHIYKNYRMQKLRR